MNDPVASSTVALRRVWLFGANLSFAELTALLDPDVDYALLSANTHEAPPVDGEYRDPLAYLLGATWLDHDFVEVIDPSTLGEAGLAGYLLQVIGVDAAQVEAVHEMLAVLRNPVIIVLEAAFGGNPTRMHPDPRFVHLGTYTNQPAPVTYRAAQFVPTMPRKAVNGYGVIIAPLVVLATLALVFWGN